MIRVLIVDDEPDVADVLNEAATRFGHRTAVALDGAHALRAVREFAPHVVLLDIRMSGMDGLRCSSTSNAARSRRPSSSSAEMRTNRNRGNSCHPARSTTRR